MLITCSILIEEDMTLTSNIQEKVKEIEQQVIEWRRYLHRHPELSFEEVKTSQFVYDTLQSFGNLEIMRPTKTSVMARLIGDLPGKTLAIRADMDALAIQELNDFDFASETDGVMHACGHDGHTAILLGAAHILTLMKKDVAGEIRFLFQHAEELHPGGAQEMVKAGVMEGVDHVIGLHLMSPIETGIIAIGNGAMTANSDTFHISIHGQGGHASEPEKTIDPIAIGVEVVSNLQQIISRKIGVNEKAVLSVTKFNGGTANNIIPSTVQITGSLRTIDEHTREKVKQLIENICHGISHAHGATSEVDYRYGYDAVINDPIITGQISAMAEELFGQPYVHQFPPGTLMGSEDFSAFSNVVPGCFIGLGAGNKEKGIIHPHHHPEFTIDESALIRGVALFVQAGMTLNKE